MWQLIGGRGIDGLSVTVHSLYPSQVYRPHQNTMGEVVSARFAVCPPSCLIPLIVDCYISTIASLKPQAMVVLIVVIVLDVALSLSFSTSISPSLVVWCHMASTPSEPTMTPQDWTTDELYRSLVFFGESDPWHHTHSLTDGLNVQAHPRTQRYHKSFWWWPLNQ